MVDESDDIPHPPVVESGGGSAIFYAIMALIGAVVGGYLLIGFIKSDTSRPAISAPVGR
ncbi:MAG TPA: hypothetical protein VK980_04695 [Sphingomonas sp.]|nr:hypothetical protein [Sphingomonas sp.]